MAGTSNQTSSSSCPSSSSHRWDVFLSFRGEDIRKTFTDHLYTALHQAGIQTFKDDPELRKGEEISSALLNAIQDSKMSIIVFSKNYASSRWCLDELVKILECKRIKGLIVLPVFYDVNPSDVRHQIESFGKGFEKPKKRFAGDKVEKWQAALTEASKLSGYHLENDANGHESKLIQQIVKDVLQEINSKALIVAEHLVAMDSRVKDIYDKISIGSSNVRVIGIYGMGGVGKTTIAKAFYNKYFHHFERSCFLEKVREASLGYNDPLSLVKQLISELLETQDFKVDNVERGVSFLKERVRTKKVLIVLDDLDQSSQLKLLVRYWNFFGPESRIIITTRDTRLLEEFEKIDEGYMVMPYMMKTLDKDESLELLSYHAFRGTILKDFKEILERIVSYTKGLPLALEILGSFLFGRTTEEWTSTLEKLQQIPNNQILTILEISYDALDDKEKEFFLDIAFFLIGMDKEEANHIFDSCGFYPHIGIKVLEERCLLTIDRENKYRMHDLIRDMGREIVRKESIKELGERSRLWYQEEVCDVLKKQKGTKKIEGIRLDITTSVQEYFDAKTFESMPNLRLLQINNVHLTGSFENSFEELRWLCWHYCSLTCLPPSFHPPKLVSLDMQYSNVKTLWDGPKLLKSLKILNASHSPSLTTTPDFGEVKMLEKLFLRGCSSLVWVHPSIGVLGKLVHLDLSECYNLKQLPEQFGSMKGLKILKASDTGIEQLPDSIGHMARLVKLNLFNCRSLRSLPSSIHNMSSLEELNLNDCFKLVGLPGELGNMKSLQRLYARNTAIEQLPDSVGHLSRLTMLKVDDCKNLRNLPNSICNLGSLEALEIGGCLNLKNLPEQLGNMKLLSRLNISGSSINRLPDSIGLSKNLGTLVIRECSIDRLPDSFSSLRDLTFDGESVCSLPANLSQLVNLSHLSITKCTRLQSLPKLPPNLYYFSVGGCTSIKQLPNLSSLKNLRSLVLFNCSSLESLPDLPHDLHYLDASGCISLKKLSNVAALKYLEDLDLTNCRNLRNTIEESFLQGLLDRVSYEIIIPSGVIPDWFSHQRTGSLVSFDMPPNLDNNFLGMVLWAVFSSDYYNFVNVNTVFSNKTDGTRGHLHVRSSISDCELHSWVSYIGKPISMKSQDRIEVVFEGFDKVERCGVYLLHNRGRKRGREIDVSETLSHLKRLKLWISDVSETISHLKRLKL